MQIHGRNPLDQVDLAGRRLDPEDLNRPLEEYTAEAITDYLDYRHGRWPNSTNPHLLINRNTATTTTAVSASWMDKLVRPLPVRLDRLRQDRILEEALASGADPLHLAHVFGQLDGRLGGCVRARRIRSGQRRRVRCASRKIRVPALATQSLTSVIERASERLMRQPRTH